MSEHIFHTFLELFCVLIELAAFIAVLLNYDKKFSYSHIMGFGYLAVAIFNLLHVFFSHDANIYPSRYYDLDTRFLTLMELTEALVIAGCAFRIRFARIRKWGGLLITMVFSAGISYLVYAFPYLIPVFSTSQGEFPYRILFDYAVIALLVASTVKIAVSGDIINDRIKRYFFTASLLAVFGSLSFTVLKNVLPFSNILGHTLRAFFYLFLFCGIFSAYVIYPNQRLEKANEQIKELLDSLPVPLVNFNSSGSLYFANKLALGMLACGLGEIQGLSVRQFIEKFRISLLEYVKTTDEMAAMSDNSFKGLLAVITNCHGNAVKVRIDCHRPENAEYTFFFRDAKKEQELQYLQLQTKTVLDSISDFVVVTDKQDTIVLCNKASADMIEIREDAIIGMNIDKLFDMLQIRTENNPESHEQISDCLEKHFIVSIVTAQGKRKKLLFNSSDILNIDGEAIGRIFSASDITDLHREQQRLQQQEKLALLGQMGAAIAHEAKNYLATIKGIGQLLALLVKDDTIREYVQRIESAADEVNRIIGDFLSLSKPRLPVMKEVLLNGVVQSVINILSISSFLSGISVKISLDPDEKAVICDESQIKQVILNICKNAVEAMEGVDAPELRITTGKWGKEEGMYLEIRDNGKGMSDEQKEMLGTPFYTTKDYGTGLGLSVSFNIIREHGGRIEIDSEIGKGTCFRVLLPFERSALP